MSLPGAEAEEPLGPGSGGALPDGRVGVSSRIGKKGEGRALKNWMGGGRKVQQAGGCLFADRPEKPGLRLPGIRPALIRWAAILADHSRETLIDFLERSREVLKALTEEEGSFLLSRGWTWPAWTRRFPTNSF